MTDAEQEDAAYQRAHETGRAWNWPPTWGWRPAPPVEADTTVWSAICEAAQELGPDVIVTGSRGASGWKSLWQSSTTSGVLHNAGIPVFVVPPLSDE